MVHLGIFRQIGLLHHKFYELLQLVVLTEVSERQRFDFVQDELHDCFAAHGNLEDLYPWEERHR